MALIAGVDEAGRGPVLGPMVMALCAIEKKDLQKLTLLGVKDSKLLSKPRREELYKEITRLCIVKKIIVTPSEVDNAVNAKNDNLNLLEARTTAKLIRMVGAEAIVDCPSINAQKYCSLLKELSGSERIKCEHKADYKYPIVAAASIVAKVIRDREMAKISRTLGVDLGSGYMTDHKTNEWLKRNYNKNFGFIRRSWASVKNLESENSQRRLFEFKRENKEFEKLIKHGFRYEPTTNPYEVVRLKGKGATIIKYTTGKLVIQGPGKLEATALLQSLKLL